NSDILSDFCICFILLMQPLDTWNKKVIFRCHSNHPFRLLVDYAHILQSCSTLPLSLISDMIGRLSCLVSTPRDNCDKRYTGTLISLAIPFKLLVISPSSMFLDSYILSVLISSK